MKPEVKIRSQFAADFGCKMASWAKFNGALIVADCAVEDGVHVNGICNTVIDPKVCGL